MQVCLCNLSRVAFVITTCGHTSLPRHLRHGWLVSASMDVITLTSAYSVIQCIVTGLSHHIFSCMQWSTGANQQTVTV